MATTTKGVAQKSLQDAILDAIDYLADEKMSKLTLDKTIVAIIVKRKDVLQNTYYINYQDNKNLVAKAQGDTVYKNGQQVYVLVPQNDLSNDKLILGTASADKANSESNFISSVMNDYTYSGESAFKQNLTPFGLRSWHVKDSQAMYASDEFREESNSSYDDYKNYYAYNEKFSPSVKGSQKIMLKAEFRTDLSLKHRIPTCGGEYGVKILATFKTQQVDHYYREKKLEDGTTVVETTKKDENDNDVPLTHLDKDVQAVYKKKHQLFTLESSSSAFTGQPFNYPSYTEQYAIFDFDADNFEGIDSVIIYSQNFTPTDPRDDTYDIWVKNIQMYALSKITSVQGDYSLRLNPASLVFLKTDSDNMTDEQKKEDKLSIVSTKADFRKKSLSLSNDSRMKFVWGSEDKSVTSLSSSFHGYLGSGWKYLPDAGDTCQFVTRKNENRAYENRYKCSAIYTGDNDASVILVQEFVVYNMDASRDIKITSDLGENFAFDIGTPMLTCSVNGISDSEALKNYSFVWSIAEDDGTSRKILSEEEAQATLDAVRARLAEGTVSISELTSAQNDRALAEGVKYGKGDNKAHNFLTLPISAVSSVATVYCTVYEYDAEEDDRYCVGTASIRLTNSKSVEVAKYHIVIENGSQSFQYSETGVSPCDAQYMGQDYQEILPLTCHFFEPNGLEVPSTEYVIQWAIPTSDTFFVVGEDELNDKNSSADTGEMVSNSQVLTFKIQDRWRYSYTNRQITAIVTYQGEEFRKDTDFLFAKIGDNGTNGTDYVVKIVPKDDKFFPLPSLVEIPSKTTSVKYDVKDDKGNVAETVEYTYHDAFYEQNCLPAMYMKHYTGTLEDSTTESFLFSKKATLTAELYQRGTKATAEEYTWNLVKSGSFNDTYPFTLSSAGTLGWDFEPKKKAFRGQVIRVASKVNIEKTDDGEDRTWDTVYGFYPMPVVRSYMGDDNAGYTISLNKTYTLQQVLYNADGKYPQYDTDRGFKVDGVFYCDNLKTDKVSFTRIKDKDLDGFTVKAFTYGGQLEGPIVGNDGTMHNSSTSSLVKCEEISGQDDIRPVLRRYAVTPSENYSGAYQNNGIYVVVEKDGTAICDVWIPVYMSLNRYGLASLNKWDGNSIEIESNEGNRSYILAPQIGAGIKNDDNSFTGVVMGSRFESTEDEEGRVTEKNDVGVFGYHAGKQSIFLDAKTGNAEFGLPEDKADKNNGNYEGRIVLTPGGKSTIANWTLASNTLYGASRLIEIGEGNNKRRLDWTTAPVEKEENGKTVRYWPQEENYITKTTATTKSNGTTDVTVTYSDDYFNYLEYDRDLGEPYNDYKVIGAKLGIPESEQGILLSSTPPYFSAKSHPLTRSNSDIDWDNGLCLLNENDSLEVEIDPNKTSIFTIYQHQDSRRSPLVGIDENGSFYTNSVKQENTTMTINRIGAFGLKASNWSRSGDDQYPNYIGVNFSYDRATIVKLFEPTNTSCKDYENYTYLTTGTSTENEYAKGFRINAKSFESYVTTASKSADGATARKTPHKLILTQTEDFYGSENDTFLHMNQGTKNGSYLALKKQDGENSFYGLDVKLADGQNRTTKLANGDKQCLQLSLSSEADNVVLESGSNAKLALFEGSNGYAVLQRDSSKLLKIDSSSGTLKVSNGEVALKDSSFNLSIGTYGDILSANKDNNGEVLLRRINGDNKGSKLSLSSNISLTTNGSMALSADNSITGHAGNSFFVYTTGLTEDGKENEAKRNSILMNDDTFALHSQRNVSFNLYDHIGNLKILTGTTLNHSLVLTHDNDYGGIYFENATQGLAIRKYSATIENTTENGNFYGITRGTTNLGYALLLQDGGLGTTSISLRGDDSDNEPKTMGKDWFTWIQKFYNSGVGVTDGDGFIGYNGENSLRTEIEKIPGLQNSINAINKTLSNFGYTLSVSTATEKLCYRASDNYVTVKGTDNKEHRIYTTVDKSITFVTGVSLNKK